MAKYLSVFSRTPLNHLIYAIDVLLACLASLLVVIVSYYVVTRYFFQRGFYGFEEIVILIAVWLYFLGSARASMEQSHISADMVKLFVKKETTKTWFHLIQRILSVVITLALFLLSADFLYFNVIHPAKTIYLKIPKSLYYLSMLLGFMLMIFFESIHLAKCVLVIKEQRRSIRGAQNGGQKI